MSWKNRDGFDLLIFSLEPSYCVETLRGIEDDRGLG
jgi:hypothetical protein